MATNKLFPLSVAKGDAFCNREDERARIKGNIASVTHTLVISPRRYGKTSLIVQSLFEEGIAYGYTQFFNAYREQAVLERFIEAANGLLTHLVSPTQKALRMVGKFISNAKVSLKLGQDEIKFSLEPTQIAPCKFISSLLSDIEKLLASKGKQAVLFLDEFQDIIDSDGSDELQSVIRDFAQHAEHLIFIVSGSNRRMLEKIFNDKNKPFYKLFDQIQLGRISQEKYIDFINKHAKLRWGRELDDDFFESLFSYTKCHSYYVNNICKRLWRNEGVPDAQGVNDAWIEMVSEELSSVSMEISKLTKNQRIVLQELATHEYLKEPASSKFQLQTQLTHSSIVLTVSTLNKYDFIEKTDRGYRIIDPLMKHVLQGASLNKLL